MPVGVGAFPGKRLRLVTLAQHVAGLLAMRADAVGLPVPEEGAGVVLEAPSAVTMGLVAVGAVVEHPLPGLDLQPYERNDVRHAGPPNGDCGESPAIGPPVISIGFSTMRNLAR